MNPARGCLVGILLSLPMWAMAYVLFLAATVIRGEVFGL